MNNQLFGSSFAQVFLAAQKWEFPTIRGTVFGGLYNKDPTI